MAVRACAPRSRLSPPTLLTRRAGHVRPAGLPGDVAYLVDVGDDVLPFDRGCVRNLSDFLTRPALSEYRFEMDEDGQFRRHRSTCGCFG